MSRKIADIRKKYSKKKLQEKNLAKEPISQFAKWWKQAVAANLEEVNAMTLATASSDGMPSARIVLLKDFSKEGFSFFTNYKSYKSQQLLENPKACLVFFWKKLERQVRITGLVEKLPVAVSKAYFSSRPKESQIGATVSPQSEVIKSRKWLDNQFKKQKKAAPKNGVPMPEHWGGFIVKPVIVEFWQGRPGRLHDRIQYSLDENGQWIIERLAP